MAERVTTVVASPVTEYAERVLAGDIVACNLVKQACSRHMRWLEEGRYEFDEQEAQKAVGFFPLLKQRQGRQFAGKPLELALWQQFCTGFVFGWKHRDTGYRVTKVAWIEVPVKNGKTTWAAGIGNRLVGFDGEPGAEVYVAATTREQANKTFVEAKWQIDHAEEAMRDMFDLRAANILVPENGSRFTALGKDLDGRKAEGINAHGLLIDELHAWVDREYYNTLDARTGARVQPLIWVTTTAGSLGSTLYLELNEYARGILDQTIPDDSWFVYIATIDDGDDPFDEDVWWKCNPNLGVSKSLDYMRDKALKAKHMPSEMSAFLRYQCNKVTALENAYLSMDVWDGQDKPKQMASLLGRQCWAGIDLSEKHDLTALALWFPDDDRNGGDLLTWFWVPQYALEKRAKEDRVPYGTWETQGFLETTPGEVVDYGFLLKRFMELRDEFDIRAVWMDPYKGRQLGVLLGGEGFEVKEIHQGFSGIGPCIGEMTRVLENNGLRHGGHPVMRWMAGNVAVRMNSEMQVKFDKQDDRRRIDGMVAAAMAIGAAASEETNDDSWIVR